MLDGSPLTIGQVESVARRGVPVRLSDDAAQRMAETRAGVEKILGDGRAYYGINTGFGSLARTRIDSDKLRDLQQNLIRSHAAGVGEDLPSDIVRAMMLLLAASLARGVSGARPVVAETIAAMLNAGVTPCVPSVGSVGASGDLAPLAHLSLALLGEGEALFGGRRCPAAEALKEAGLTPLQLEAKEGLSLINGTHLMAAEGALLLADTGRLLDGAFSACAMSIDAMKGTDRHLDPRVHEVRRQPGQIEAAARLQDLLSGSEILPSHATDDPRVQDAYSLRCAAPVLGAAMDAADYVKLAIERELGAVTDNPLVFSSGDTLDVISAGNFHGIPLAIPLDVLSIALSHIAGIAERRVYLMLAARDPEAGLNPYLASHPGLQSGLMIAQYTAAACCNEMIGLATPASVANIPTSAGIEDYNSFGPRAAAKARRSLELARSVVAIELLCAAQAIEHHRPLRSGVGVERAHEVVRGIVPPLEHDRPPSPDIRAIAEKIAEGAFSPVA
ncbi:MAG: histidine ammonia-lyase [Phycisphaerales bacterium]|nr:MAG: histidine ammonia-lyase [Phycisphaerales bacterium]